MSDINAPGARPSARVVGVVGDVHDTRLDQPADQFFYPPIVDAAGGDAD